MSQNFRYRTFHFQHCEFLSLKNGQYKNISFADPNANSYDAIPTTSTEWYVRKETVCAIVADKSIWIEFQWIRVQRCTPEHVKEIYCER